MSLLHPQIHTKSLKYSLVAQVSGEGSGAWSISLTHEFHLKNMITGKTTIEVELSDPLYSCVSVFYMLPLTLNILFAIHDHIYLLSTDKVLNSCP